MMGVAEDPGVVPRMCEGLFEHIRAEATEQRQFLVEASYYEVCVGCWVVAHTAARGGSRRCTVRGSSLDGRG